MRKQSPVRMLFIALSLFLLIPQTFVSGNARAANTTYGAIQIENRNDTDAAFSCDVKLSGKRIQGSVFAVLFSESEQIKFLADYPASETVRVSLKDVSKTDYIKILWADEQHMPLANPVVLRMEENNAAAYENFTKQLAASLQPYQGGAASSDSENPYALARLLVSCDALPDLSDYKGKVTTVSGPNRLHILQFYDPIEASKCKNYLESFPSVRYVEPDAVMQANATESRASSSPHSWGVSKTGSGEYAENLRQRGDSHGVIVAVVDSGVESSHPFLKNRLIAGYDFIQYDEIPQDEHGHGTHVTGTIVDCTPDMDVKIMPVRVLDAFASGSYLSIANGIRYAADHGANIINLSLGSTNHSQTIDEAVNYALSKNITVVVAAGNKMGNVDYFCPAHMENCITVAAVDSDLKRYELSNYGDAVDMAAPGVGIESSILKGKYGEMNGTSMATPHVSAAAALLMSERGTGQTPFQISSLLRDAATDVGEPGKDVYFGAGFLNMRPFIVHSAYAMLYADGELVFQKNNTPALDRALIKSYPVAISRDGSGQYAAWHDRYSDIRKVTFAESIRPTSTALWFYGCENLSEVHGIENLDASGLTDMSQMFARCGSLKTLDLSDLDTSAVSKMNSMFFHCEALTELDLTGWNTKSVTDTRDMFIGCAALKTVYASDSFSMEKTTDSEGMFQGCHALVGGQSTPFDNAHTDKEYAHIDGGASAPGYFTDKNAPLPSNDIYAVLYSDGELVFQNNNRTESGRSLTDVYKVDGNYSWTAPWNEENVKTVTFADKIQPSSTAVWFSGCSNLTDVRRIENLDTSKVTDMRRMFAGCSNLTELDLSSFDTSNVEYMGGEHEDAYSHYVRGMFSDCKNLKTLNTSGWDTRKVKNMTKMFDGCNSLENLDISGWDTRNVTEMCGMFDSCSILTELDLSGFDTSNVLYMDKMFFACIALKTIYVGDSFVTESVSASNSMFYNCASLVGGAGTKYDSDHTDISYAHIDDGTSAPGYFTDKNAPTPTPEPDPVPSTDIYAVLYGDGELVFQNNNRTESGRSVTDVYEVKDSRTWGKQSANITSVTFADKIQPTSTEKWFEDCWKLGEIRNIENLDTSHVVSMRYMFYNCCALRELDVSGFNTSDVTDMSWMFTFCTDLKELNVSGFDTSNVTDMSEMFGVCSNLSNLNISSFNTANVTRMTGMFSDCLRLSELNMSGIDTSNVISMAEMFRACNSLTELDASSFDTSKVSNMFRMFEDCKNLKAIYVSESFVTEQAETESELRPFKGCVSLVGGAGTKYDSEHVNISYARIDGGASAPGYFTRK